MAENRIRRKREKAGKLSCLLLAVVFVLACLTCLAAWGVGAFEPPAPRLFQEPTALPRESEAASSAEEQVEPSSGRLEGVSLDVPFIDQRQGWPTGCESVCAVMALRYFGVDITVDGFIDGYLPLGAPPCEDGGGTLVGCDPRQAFPGDPRSEDGWGCYAPVIFKATERLLREREETSLSIKDLSGETLESLCENYVAEETPVLVWATIDMEQPVETTVFRIEGTEEEFQWVYPMHCVLLTGWDDKNYIFNDPLSGKSVSYPKAEVELAYDGLGRQALAIVS